MVPSKRTRGQLFAGVKRLPSGPRKFFPSVALDPRNRVDLRDFPSSGRPATLAWALPSLEIGRATIPGRIHAMKTMATATVMLLMLGLLGAPPTSAADDSKVKEGTQQVESGGKQIGHAVADTAKGVGKTVVGGAEVAGDKIKEAGDAAKPQAKNAWDNVRDGSVSFGLSVKTFFTRLFSSSKSETKSSTQQ